jgi:hypothetical protein
MVRFQLQMPVIDMAVEMCPGAELLVTACICAFMSAIMIALMMVELMNLVKPSATLWTYQ